MSDAGSTGSEDLTVEEQNVTNAESDDIHRLLSNFMDSKEESLEELVGGFMYLTMDDLRQSNNRAVAAALNQTSQAPAIETAKTTNKGDNKHSLKHTDAGSVSTQSKTATEKSVVTSNAGGGEGSDDIEEEVLDDISPGQQSGACFLRQRPSLTKFDNFVVTEEEGDKDDANSDSETYKADKAESDDEDWLPASGYSASFATNAGQSTQKIDASGHSKKPVTVTTTTTISTESATAAFTRNSKKPTTTTTTTAVVTSKTETETAASSSSSIGDVPSLHTKSASDTNKSTKAAVVATSDIETCVDNCDTSSLTAYSETAVCSERSKLDLESKTSTKLGPKTATTVDTEASSKPMETQSKDEDDDNEGEDNESHLIHTNHANVKQNKMNDRGMFENPSSASQGDDDECDERSEGCDLDLEAPAWTLNPGEVEEEEGRNAVMKVRVMDFSTKVVADATLDGNAEPVKEEEETTEASSDEVVPFSLDGDFDYDNVAYTPKYTADDIRYFMSFMPDGAKS